MRSLDHGQPYVGNPARAAPPTSAATGGVTPVARRHRHRGGPPPSSHHELTLDPPYRATMLEIDD